MKEILDLAREENLFIEKRVGISIIEVSNPQNGIEIAKKVIYKISDPTTILFLSGGSTPKPLYVEFVKEGVLKAAAAALIDERFGKKFHDFSNEKMIEETGLLDYFASQNIRFYFILNGESDISKTVLSYEEEIRRPMSELPKKVAIMGIGSDGHTAGLPAEIQNSKFKSQNYATEINNFPGEIKERITLTFKALSEMDLLLILAFGSDKKKALKMMFREGSIEEIPARFYTLPEISKKTLLITDQKI